MAKAERDDNHDDIINDKTDAESNNSSNNDAAGGERNRNNPNPHPRDDNCRRSYRLWIAVEFGIVIVAGTIVGLVLRYGWKRTG
jgi:hypothetical protein